MDNGSIEIKISIPADRIADLLEAAYNGGIGYWCRVMEYEGQHPEAHTFAEAPLMSDHAVICRIDDGGSETDEEYKPLRLDQAAIVRGLTLFPTACPRAFGDFMAENEDSNTGDLFVQLCLLGKIVYG